MHEDAKVVDSKEIRNSKVWAKTDFNRHVFPHLLQVRLVPKSKTTGINVVVVLLAESPSCHPDNGAKAMKNDYQCCPIVTTSIFCLDSNNKVGQDLQSKVLVIPWHNLGAKGVRLCKHLVDWCKQTGRPCNLHNFMFVEKSVWQKLGADSQWTCYDANSIVLCFILSD